MDTVSLCGGRHPLNQDCGCVRQLDQCTVLVLSDGLGSRTHADRGSALLCDSVIREAEEQGEGLRDLTPQQFAEKVHRHWCKAVRPWGIGNCEATLVAVLLMKESVLMVQMGDGFAAVLADGVVRVLLDEKRERFLNQTSCFSERFRPEEVTGLRFPCRKPEGCVLCSDGVEVGDMTAPTVGKFCREFSAGYSGMSREAIRADVSRWLEDWPGEDDKTLVYALPEQEVDR